MLAMCNAADHCNGLAFTHRGCADHVVHDSGKRRSYCCDLVAEKVHEDAEHRTFSHDIAVLGYRANNALLRSLDQSIVA